MKLIVSGKTQEFTPALQKKFDYEAGQAEQVHRAAGRARGSPDASIGAPSPQSRVERKFLRPFAGWAKAPIPIWIRRCARRWRKWKSRS